MVGRACIAPGRLLQDSVAASSHPLISYVSMFTAEKSGRMEHGAQKPRYLSVISFPHDLFRAYSQDRSAKSMSVQSCAPYGFRSFVGRAISEPRKQCPSPTPAQPVLCASQCTDSCRFRVPRAVHSCVQVKSPFNCASYELPKSRFTCTSDSTYASCDSKSPRTKATRLMMADSARSCSELAWTFANPWLKPEPFSDGLLTLSHTRTRLAWLMWACLRFRVYCLQGFWLLRSVYFPFFQHMVKRWKRCSGTAWNLACRPSSGSSSTKDLRAEVQRTTEFAHPMTREAAVLYDLPYRYQGDHIAAVDSEDKQL